MKTNRKLVLALAGVLAALAAASIGWAAIPETNGTIHGCYKKDSGALRVYDATTNAPKACTDKESPLDWQQGGASKAYWNPSSVMSWLDATSWPGSQVASSSVPAGSYMFMANTILKPFGLNSAQHLVQCRLNAHDNLTGRTTGPTAAASSPRTASARRRSRP
jgi:hypothetical protein